MQARLRQQSRRQLVSRIGYRKVCPHNLTPILPAVESSVCNSHGDYANLALSHGSMVSWSSIVLRPAVPVSKVTVRQGAVLVCILHVQSLQC